MKRLLNDNNYCTERNVMVSTFLTSLFSFSPDNDDPFHIALEGSGPSRLRKRHQVVSLGNGLHLVHYRCFSDHEALTISVTHDGKHVDRSPYMVAFATDESCACPLKSSKEWLEDFECRSLAEEKQILSSLRPFREGGINISRLYDRGAELYSHRSFIHYSIVDGTVSSCDSVRVFVGGEYPGAHK